MEILDKKEKIFKIVKKKNLFENIYIFINKCTLNIINNKIGNKRIIYSLLKKL